MIDADGFKRIVEYTGELPAPYFAQNLGLLNIQLTMPLNSIFSHSVAADPVHGFNAVVTREPVQNFVKKVYSPYDEPNHLVKHVPIAQPHHHVPHAQNAPIVKTYTAPHSVYAPPEHPKFFKPVLEKKFIKPAYEPIKYVTPAAHYNHY